MIEDEDLEGYLATSASLLGISIDPEWMPSVLANLKATLALALSVAEFELPDDIEPAPVFEA